MSDLPSSGSEAELSLVQEAFRDVTQTSDQFTFESGVPDDFDDGDNEPAEAPWCGDCWTYHVGECL